MFNSISNNFGAGVIQFKDFQSEKLTILNAMFSFNPDSGEYQAAETLEIKVPNLKMKKSAVTAAFVVSSEENYQYGTVLKTWIKDANTICIEKIEGWNQPGPWTIYINAAYVKLGCRSAVEVTGTLTPAIGSDMTGFRSNGFYATAEPGWCYVCFRFRTSNSLEHDKELVFHFTGLPEDTDCNVPIVFMNASVDKKGSPIGHAHIKGNELTIYGIPPHVYTSNDGHFINVFMVRGSESTE